MNAAARPMPTPDLAGLLRKPTPETPVTRDAVEERTVDTASERVPRHRGESQPRQLEVPAAGTVHGRQYLRSIALYLPRSLHRRLGAEAKRRDTTRTALVLTAINATHDRLGPELQTKQPGETKTDLFDIPQARAGREPTVQTTIRVTDSQYQALAGLATQYDSNRSQVIATGLRLYLADHG